MTRVCRVLRPQPASFISPTTRIARHRNWKEHHLFGDALKEPFLRKKEQWFRKRYTPKVIDAENGLFEEYRGLQEVPFSRFGNELAMQMLSLQHSHPKIEQELLYIYQNTLVKRWSDPQLSIETTHLYFADLGSVVLAVNMQPRYSYGKIFTAEKQITVFDCDGRREEFEEEGMCSLEKTLKQIIHQMLSKRARNKMGSKKDWSPQEAEGLSQESPSENSTFAVSFADCSGDGDGAALLDTPDHLNTLQEENEAHKSQSKAFLLSTPPSMEKSDRVPSSEYVRPIFSVFIQPFLHHMVSPRLVALLPESSVFKPRLEYIGGDHSRFMKRWGYLPESQNFVTDRSSYPPPPPELLAATQQLGGARSFHYQETVSHWSTDRSAYRREWQPDWTKGWLPQSSIAIKDLSSSESDEDVVLS